MHCFSHVRRGISRPRFAASMRYFNLPVRRPKVVILGTGWAGFRFFRDLDCEKYDVSIVSPRNHMLFTPLLTSTAVGTLETRSICEPIRPWASKKNAHFYQAGCSKIDIEEKKIFCSTKMSNTMILHEFELDYDHLIIAVGAQPNSFGIPGVKEYGNYMKETGDAVAVRAKILTRLEEASHPSVSTEEMRKLLTFVICGGGPTGIEFAAELTDFLEDDCQKHYPEIYANHNVILLEGQQILGMFGKSLQNFTLRRFRKRKIDIRTGRFVTKVTQDRVTLSNGDEIPYGVLVWSAGVQSRAFVRELDVAKNEKGTQILLDEHLKIKDSDNIWALGDCAEVEGHFYPQTAQVANQQGMYLAAMFNSDDGPNDPQKAFKWKNLGKMVYTGKMGALIEGKGFVRLSGFVAFLGWRSAYWTMQGSWRNFLMVPFDWFKAMVFGRDVSRF